MENMKNIGTEMVKETEEITKMNKKTYDVTVVLEDGVDGEENTEFSYGFKEPNPLQFTRYIKELHKDVVQASRNIVLANILAPDKERLQRDITEYPGMVITIANKFLAMLGFTDNVTFRRR